MFIGLKYENGRFHWYDRSPFNYSDFLEPYYKSQFYTLKKNQCKRFFMYSPPTSKLILLLFYILRLKFRMNSLVNLSKLIG